MGRGTCPRSDLGRGRSGDESLFPTLNLPEFGRRRSLPMFAGNGPNSSSSVVLHPRRATTQLRRWLVQWRPCLEQIGGREEGLVPAVTWASDAAGTSPSSQPLITQFWPLSFLAMFAGNGLNSSSSVALHPRHDTAHLPGENLSLRTCSGGPSTCSSEPSTCSGEPSRCSGEPSTCSGEPSTCSSQPSTCSGHPSIRSSEPSTCSGEPSTCSGRPSPCSGQPFDPHSLTLRSEDFGLGRGNFSIGCEPSASASGNSTLGYRKT